MTRTEIINKIIKKNNYKSYLEIGVRNYYDNCDKIICDLKHSVDPSPENKCDYVMTSDKFFESIDINFKYDIIFIDGLHLTEQVDKDITNSLNHLSENGTIVLHDCLPVQKENQERIPVIDQWTGDVWKSILKLKMSREDLEIKIVDSDWGCGILTKGKQELYKTDIDPFNWEWYTDNYRKIIPIISIESFTEI